MAVTDEDKLDFLLLVGGEELQKLIQTLTEQPTHYKSHIEKLDQHFKANRNNTGIVQVVQHRMDTRHVLR